MMCFSSKGLAALIALIALFTGACAGNGTEPSEKKCTTRLCVSATYGCADGIRVSMTITGTLPKNATEPLEVRVVNETGNEPPREEKRTIQPGKEPAVLAEVKLGPGSPAVDISVLVDDLLFTSSTIEPNRECQTK